MTQMGQIRVWLRGDQFQYIWARDMHVIVLVRLVSMSWKLVLTLFGPNLSETRARSVLLARHEVGVCGPHLLRGLAARPRAQGPASTHSARACCLLTPHPNVYSLQAAGISNLTSKLGQIGPKWGRYGTF